jgi:hypothetical protein
MKAKLTLRFKIVASIVLIISFVCGGIVCLLYFESSYIVGRPYHKNSVEDLRQLRTFCYLAKPAILSLNKYYSRHRRYPEHIRGIDGDDWLQKYFNDVFHAPCASPFFTGFDYLPSQNYDTYIIRMKANWEDYLLYESSSHKWMFFRNGSGWDIMAMPTIQSGERNLGPHN